MSSSAGRAKVLSGFRRLNRARMQLFQGDQHAMAVSRMQMRAAFEENRHLKPSGPEYEAFVAGIDEAADMLQHEIVRGKLNDDTGRYGKKRKKKKMKLYNRRRPERKATHHDEFVYRSHHCSSCFLASFSLSRTIAAKLNTNGNISRF